MGSGIAQVAAEAGLSVRLSDVNEEAVQKGLETIEKYLARSVEKERISQGEMDEALGRIESGLEYAPDADLAIEAVPETIEVKTEVFGALDKQLEDDAILASNTSSISITELAAYTGRPERFIGMHFFNPVPVMGLVEIIRGVETSDETYETARELTERLGKKPIEVGDFPGFAVNRLLVPMINEASFCVMEGVAGPEEMDTAMKQGAGFPMGPLELADMVGVDTSRRSEERRVGEEGRSRRGPDPLK